MTENNGGLDPDVDMVPPTPRETMKFLPVDLREFHEARVLWAVNFFVLWPLGLALTISKDKEDDYSRATLDVREWVYPDDEQTETINVTEEENSEYYQEFLAYVRRRLMNMKSEDRVLALKAYESHMIASVASIMVAG